MPEQRLNLILSATDEATEVFDSVGDSVETFVEDVGDEADKIPGKFDTAFSGLTGKVNSGIASGISGVSGLLSTTFTEGSKLAVNVIGDTMKEGMIGLGVDPELAGNLQRFGEGMLDKVSAPLVTGLTSKVTDLGADLAGKIATSGIGAAVSGAMATVGTLAGTAMTAAIALAPLLLPALLIAAIVAAIVLIIKNPEILAKAAKVGIDFVTGIINGLIGLATSLVTEIVKVIGGLWEAGVGIAKEVVAFANKIPGAIVDGLINLGTEIIKFIVGVIQGLWEAEVGIAKAILEFAGNLVGGIIDGLVSLPGKVLRFLQDLFAALPNFFINVIPKIERAQTGADPIGDFLFGPRTPPKGEALGGSVFGNTPYIVGERGPELFVPGRAGAIVPNSQLGGGRSVSLVTNMTVNGADDPEQWATSYTQAVARKLRREGIID